MRTALHRPALLAALLAGCGESSDPRSPADVPPDPVLNEHCLIEGKPGEVPALALTRAYPNLSFASPVALHATPAVTSALLVAERGGVIRMVADDDSATSADVLLDISDRVGTGADEGLHDVALHPTPGNFNFYVAYTPADAPARWVVSRFNLGRSGSGDPASELPLLSIDKPASARGGLDLLFGPDGYLYIAVPDGDGADSGAQDATRLVGSILRVEVVPWVDGYGIPAGNPLVGQAGAAEERYAWGLHRPARCAFDAQTDELWCGDAGGGAWEEVNVISAGGNYGWPLMAGADCLEPSVACGASALTRPRISYRRPTTPRAIIGGAPYRGAALPELVGVYVHADQHTGLVSGLRHDGSAIVDARAIADTELSLTAIGEDAAGEIIFAEAAGGLYRLSRPAGAVAPRMPATLSASGCYTDLAQKTVDPSFLPFEVNSVLWSDGAHKRRFVGLSGPDVLGFRDEGAFDLPVGVILIKEFWLERDPGVAASRRPVETRFLVRRQANAGLEGFSYMWDDAGTDATLLESSARRTYTLDSGATHDHYFPSRGDCSFCHSQIAGLTLGLRADQLNRAREDGQNQLAYLHAADFFDGDPGAPADLPHLSNPYDASEPLERRARSYLAANCSHCHRPGGPTFTSIDLRFSTTFAATLTCNASPFDDLGVSGARIIKPGAAAESVLYLRMTRRGPGQMPPLATYQVDEDAAQLIADWIGAMSGCP